MTRIGRSPRRRIGTILVHACRHLQPINTRCSGAMGCSKAKPMVKNLRLVGTRLKLDYLRLRSSCVLRAGASFFSAVSKNNTCAILFFLPVNPGLFPIEKGK